jgi:hypothetical protein
MKKIYLIGLASLLFAACSSNDEPNVVQQTEANARYMAVSLVANNSNSRADYANGAADEYAVVSKEKLQFYFFDAAGKAFDIDGNGNNYVAGQDIKDWTTETAENVTVSNVVCVIKEQKGETPTQVVAVVNANFDAAKMDLDVLRAKVVEDAYLTDTKTTEATADAKATTVTTKYFVMSNSVYQDNGETMYATAIGADNFQITEELAEKNAVEIYVERVVGKVTIESPEKDDLIGLKDTSVTYADGTEAPALYAKLVGWKLFNTATQTYLEKDLADYAATDWTWNRPEYYRSFWSVVPSTLTLDTSALSYNDMAENYTVAYPFENTLTSETADVNTSMAIAAQITDKDGKAQDIALWLSKYYTLEQLKTVVANYLANTLYSYDADAKTWASITANDITFETIKLADGNYDYHVLPVLADASSKWYKKNSTEAISSEDVTAILKAVPRAQIWKDGMCYYYTPITHLNGANAIVRNHWYQLTINSITGLGTPVYEPDKAVDPTKPGTDDDDTEWFLSAKINIQSWRIVGQTVDLTSTK